MIHISQEELFRKIETEHRDCSNSRLSPQQEKGEEQSAALHSESGARGSRRGSCASIGSNECNPRLLCQDISSMMLDDLQASKRAALTATTTVPSTTTTAAAETTTTTTGTRKDSLSRDKNNNAQTTNHQAAATAGGGGGGDEVQAVLITGCGSKIGTNIAVAFAAQGLKVALVDFDIQQTEAVAQECQEKSPKNRVPLQIVADMSQLAEAHKVIDRTIEAFGRLDVLVNTVNNVGLMEAKFNASGDDDPHVFEQYHKIIANNMHAVTYLCISAAPYLRKTKGTIVNVSSITNNETGSGYKFAYCMSKAGISTLTKCLATDLAPDIKVICVSPKSDAGA